MQRRTFLSSSLIAAALAAAPILPVWAAGSLPYDDKGDPFAFVVDLSNAVLERIRGSDSLKSGNIDALRELVDGIIMPATDFTMMTRMTVGPKWRTATKEQRKALEEGFETLLMRVYAGGLSAVRDQKCELRPTRVKTVRPEMVVLFRVSVSTVLAL